MYLYILHEPMQRTDEFFFAFIKGFGIFEWDKKDNCVSSCQTTNIAFP